MTQAKHTAGELRSRGHKIYLDGETNIFAETHRKGLEFGQITADANAARIVLTWNAHDDLVKALERAAVTIEVACPDLPMHSIRVGQLREAAKEARAALAKAGVK